MIFFFDSYCACPYFKTLLLIFDCGCLEMKLDKRLITIESFSRSNSNSSLQKTQHGQMNRA